MLRPVLLPLALLLAVAAAHAAETPNSKPPTPNPSPAPAAAAPADTEDDDDIIKTDNAPAKPSLAEQKYWEAIKLLDSKTPADLEKGRATLRTAADLEYSHAQYLLAECLMTAGYGFPKDKRKAANLYRLAAEHRNGYARVSLGQCYYHGNGVRKNKDTAAQWLNAALAPDADFTRPAPPPDFFADKTATDKPASAGHETAGQIDRDIHAEALAAAHFFLGVIAQEAKNMAEAHPHFLAAATAGNDGRSGLYAAAVQTALNCAFGQGTSRDMAKANEMLDLSKRLTVHAGVRLIRNYATLKLVDDFATADIEEKISAEGDEAQVATQYAIAALFTDKKSKDYNPAEAVKWYELAADSGKAWAMLNLAFLYSGTELGQPDPAKAFAWFEKAGGGDDPKHMLGLANLAICLFHGIGTPKDTARAEALFKKNARDEYICHLGTLGQCPAAVLTFEQRLQLIETNAKTKKDPHAMYFMGLRHLHGWDIEPDLGTAVKWFKKSAKLNHGRALTQLGLAHEYAPEFFNEDRWESAKAATDWYRQASDAGDPDGMANYANMLNSGRGCTADSTQAEKLYLKCLANHPDHARAHTNLACMYEEHLKSRPKLTEMENKLRAKMLQHFEAALTHKDPYAALHLGGIYYSGKIAPKDYQKAFLYYEQASEWGLTTCHFDLGYQLEMGEGMPISNTEAAYHYRLAASDDPPHKEALRRLCNLYLSGKLGMIDHDRTAFWLEKLVRYGKNETYEIMTISGNLRVKKYEIDDARAEFIDALLNAKHYEPAIKIMKDAIANGSVFLASFASERLSQCYKNGWGVKPSPGKAKRYHEKALAGENSDALFTLSNQQFKEGKNNEALKNLTQAARGSGNACFRLGQLYYEGTHVAQSYPWSLKYMKDAVNRFHPEAYYFLAEMACNDIPGAPDLDEAIRLAQRAEATGHPKAADLRAKLERRRNQQNTAPAEETTAARSS